MKHTVEFTAGSVIGASHRKKGTNNQDSWITYCDNDLFIGLISDGCSAGGDSMIRSDVGSVRIDEIEHPFFTTSNRDRRLFQAFVHRSERSYCTPSVFDRPISTIC